MTSVFHVSVLLLMINFVVTLSKYLWIHESIAEWIHRLLSLTILWQNSFSTTGQMHKKLTSIGFYDNKLSNCPLLLVDMPHKLYIYVSVHILRKKISQWACKNFCSYRETLHWMHGLVILYFPIDFYTSCYNGK